MPRSGRRAGGVEHRVEVQHRLAHAHEDAVVDRLDPAEVERLVEDLRGGQVPAEPHLPGRAERARQRAAGLGRDADRPAAVAVAHQHRLDRLAVGGVEERLHRAVARLRLALDLERREGNVLGELGAERRRGRSSSRRSPAAPRGRPVPDLAGAVGGLAALGEEGASGARDPRAHGSAGDTT